MAITYSFRQAQVISAATAFSSTPLLGNLLYITAFTQTSTAPTISDTIGNAWTSLYPSGVANGWGTQFLWAWWAVNKTSAADTVSFSGGSMGYWVQAEYTVAGGTPSTEAVNSGAGSGTSVTVSTTGASHLGDLVLTSAGTNETGYPSGWTGRANQASWFIALAEQNNVSGNETSVWPNTNAQGSAVINVAFVGGLAAGGLTDPCGMMGMVF